MRYQLPNPHRVCSRNAFLLTNNDSIHDRTYTS